MPAQNQQINPLVTDVYVGVRNLRKIKIYPLAIADELAFTDIINKGINEFIGRGDLSNQATIAFVLDFLKKNLISLLRFVMDEEDLGEGENILKELTNPQAGAIAEVIYKNNFVEVLKNAESLVGVVKEWALASRRQLLSSVPFTADIESSISPDSDTEPVEPPEGS